MEMVARCEDEIARNCRYPEKMEKSAESNAHNMLISVPP
jgi:hypothetical protein